MMFMSGDDGGQGRTVTFLFWNQSLATWEVCFRSLSCWKMTLSLPVFFNFRSLRVPRRLCWRISTYPGPFMIPSMRCSLPIPPPVMQPHTITLPPPCLTVFFVKRGSSACPGLIQQYCRPSDLNSMNLDSSEKMTCFQSSTVQSVCAAAHAFRLATLTGEIQGLDLQTRETSPYLCSALAIVMRDT